MTTHRLALIIAAPGRIRDSLQALLKAVPRIPAIQLVDENRAALPLIARLQPALVLFDAKLTDDLPRVLQEMKAQSPQTRFIVWADTVEQQWQARRGGAEGVFLSGMSAEMFFAIVEGVLSWPNGAVSCPTYVSKQDNQDDLDKELY